jgi:protein phosphatase
MQLSWAARSDPGLRRGGNEDAYCVRPDLGLFIVADGMGGHVAGEIASRVAVEAIERFVAETESAGPQDTWPFPYETELSTAANRLKSGFRLANRGIGAAMANRQALRGMATTAAALLVGSTAGVIAHVGDSRVYLLRAGGLTRLTRDHSWVEEQVRAGVLTANAARQHPWRNVVTRALSGGEDPEVELGDVAFEPNDRVLLCSDGLYAVVDDDTIARLLGQPQAGLESICDQLIGAANDGGGPDNITVLVLQLDAR